MNAVKDYLEELEILGRSRSYLHFESTALRNFARIKYGGGSTEFNVPLDLTEDDIKEWIKGLRGTNVTDRQIVHHQYYFFCCFVLILNLLQKISPILLGSSFCDLQHALSCQWFTDDKNITHTATPVFIIIHLNEFFLYLMH
jgi:hypothetical protein